jgi:hypothetical protein
MSEDHLDKETSVSAELTPTGVKASAKSRFVAAIDRFGGNVVELLNTPIEAKNTEKRAKAESRVRTITATTDLGLELLKTDPEFAKRAIAAHFETIFARQDNKDAVIKEAIEDLRRQPPSDDESSSGPDKLSDAFQNRFERYAEEATTDELREKWGRVLAAEVRKPDTFSGKVLRVIDEMDSSTAALFERVCQHRMANVVPKALVGKLTFAESARLVSADLLIDPGLGQIRKCVEADDSSGAQLWFWALDSLAVAVTKTAARPSVENVVLTEDDKPVIPVYVLTDVGVAISSILPNQLLYSLVRLATELSTVMPESEVRKYIRSPQLDQWTMIGSIPPSHSSPDAEPISK